MECENVAYREDYADYLIEYNEEREAVLDIYRENGCLLFIDERFAVLYREKPEDYMQIFSRLEYTLFPKLYGLMDTSSVEAVGAVNIQQESILGLTGKGILIGIIDTGIDIRNDLFLDVAGNTRIIAAWDQSVPGPSDQEENPGYGTVYQQEDINEAIRNEADILTDANGHGTFLAGIAAGKRTADFTGVAPEAEYVIVKLKQAKNNLRGLYGVPEDVEAYQENDIMMGVAFLRRQASRLRKNISILIGVGSNSGSHTGSSALEALLSNVGIMTGVAVSVPAGNEGIAGHHFRGRIEGGSTYTEMEINVTGNNSFTLEIWGAVPNTYSVAFEIPGGEFVSQITPRFDKSEVIRPVFGGGIIYIDYFLVEDQSGEELIMMRFFDPPNGLWRIRVYGSGDTEKTFHAWLPITAFLSPDTRFIRPTPETTLVNPATGVVPMGVGAYDHYSDTLFLDGSRGYTAADDIKPDFVAPGIDVYGPGRAGTFVRKTGTSVAAAHCAGCAALILQWARDRDLARFVNGNQIRNYFIRGAVRPGTAGSPFSYVMNDTEGYLFAREYPNPEWGYGILNVYNTFDSLRT